jgi:transmembrane protein
MTMIQLLSEAPNAMSGVNAATITRTVLAGDTLVSPSICYWLACAGLCLAYVYSGVSKLFNFQGAIAEQAHFGLSPPALFAAATIVTQLGGSLLVLMTRGAPAALGATLLGGFTFLATLIGHQFWRRTALERVADLNSFLEHFGLIGGFALIVMIEMSRIAQS